MRARSWTGPDADRRAHSFGPGNRLTDCQSSVKELTSERERESKRNREKERGRHEGELFLASNLLSSVLASLRSSFFSSLPLRGETWDSLRGKPLENGGGKREIASYRAQYTSTSIERGPLREHESLISSRRPNILSKYSVSKELKSRFFP